MKVLGEGRLSWASAERISDRYGTVGLWKEDDERVTLESVEGRGRLVAEVVAIRKSGHIGDLFRGFFPETPEVGERIVLGEGLAFIRDNFVGLYPEDDRETDWLNPAMLYRALDQDVRLIFEGE